MVESFADEKASFELSEGLFLKRQRLGRNVAVIFLVDN
jgi:hypothetical protein